MPTVPPFDDDAARREWLQAWFKSKEDFDSWKAAWRQAVQRSDAAVTYTGYLGTALVTVLSTIQSGFSLTDSNDPSTKALNEALNYAQTAIGLGSVAVGVGAKISKGVHEQALTDLNREFPSQFFIKHGALSPADIAPPPLASTTGSINLESGTAREPLLASARGASAAPTAAPLEDKIWGPQANPPHPEQRLKSAARRWVSLC